MGVVRNELPVPRHAPRTRIECDNAIGVQIVTLAHATGKIRRWVGRGGKHQSRFRIECHRGPHGAATYDYSRGNLPRFRSRLPFERDCAKAPHRVTVGQPECTNPSANGVFRTSRSDDHEVIVNHRRHGQRLSNIRVRDFFRPHFRARTKIECDEKTIRRAAHGQSVLHRHAAILRPVGRAAWFPGVTPLGLARAGIERNGHTRCSRDQRAIHNDRIGLERAHVAQLKRADRSETRRIRWRDLPDGRVTRPRIVVRGIEPVRGVRGSGQELGVRGRSATSGVARCNLRGCRLRRRLRRHHARREQKQQGERRRSGEGGHESVHSFISTQREQSHERGAQDRQIGSSSSLPGWASMPSPRPGIRSAAK